MKNLILKVIIIFVVGITFVGCVGAEVFNEFASAMGEASKDLERSTARAQAYANQQAYKRTMRDLEQSKYEEEFKRQSSSTYDDGSR